MPTRITGGEWRGRLLHTPEGIRTRPTPSRLREALFNILGQRCDGWRVADLYAGSGSVGIEALSRGAVSCHLVENDRKAIAVIQENLSTVGTALGEIERTDVSLWCSKEHRHSQFDFVFADPPFALPFPAETSWHSLLAPGGVLVVQHPSKAEMQWSVEPDRIERYGESSIAFWTAPAGPSLDQ